MDKEVELLLAKLDLGHNATAQDIARAYTEAREFWAPENVSEGMKDKAQTKLQEVEDAFGKLGKFYEDLDVESVRSGEKLKQDTVTNIGVNEIDGGYFLQLSSVGIVIDSSRLQSYNLYSSYMLSCHKGSDQAINFVKDCKKVQDALEAIDFYFKNETEKIFEYAGKVLAKGNVYNFSASDVFHDLPDGPWGPFSKSFLEIRKIVKNKLDRKAKAREIINFIVIYLDNDYVFQQCNRNIVNILRSHGIHMLDGFEIDRLISEVDSKISNLKRFSPEKENVFFYSEVLREVPFSAHAWVGLMSCLQRMEHSTQNISAVKGFLQKHIQSLLPVVKSITMQNSAQVSKGGGASVRTESSGCTGGSGSNNFKDKVVIALGAVCIGVGVASFAAGGFLLVGFGVWLYYKKWWKKA